MIGLAHQADFQLGNLYVSPSTREVIHSDWRSVLEPRVMQVLVALRGGHVLSRDELIADCWEGRIVGDDAINRVIGKLRRLSERDGGASFTIETIARVGYRLCRAKGGDFRRDDSITHAPRNQTLPSIGAAALFLAMMLQAQAAGR